MGIRLLNTSDLRMQMWEDCKAPKYAILSHTWVHGDEVNLQQMEALATDQRHPRRRTSGFRKIAAICETALMHHYEYVWVDTCCINQQDPAELSAAINSMFRWYRKADMCYVFLADLEESEHEGYTFGSALRECRWFTRGWCLQELIAPADVLFYNRRWEFVGSKIELYKVLSWITGIDRPVLLNERPLQEIPVAHKMSWAAGRKTTRLEDTAYSLLGIFDIYMPLLYGEGQNAFYRLQEEIMKRSDDVSIFIPTAELQIRPTYEDNEGSSPNVVEIPSCDLLASSPSDFRYFDMTNPNLQVPTTVSPELFQLRFVLHGYGTPSGYGTLSLTLRKVGPSRFLCVVASNQSRPASVWRCKPQDVYVIARVTPLAQSLAKTASAQTARFVIVAPEKDLLYMTYKGRPAIQPVYPKPQWDESGCKFVAWGVTTVEDFVGTVKIALHSVAEHLFGDTRDARKWGGDVFLRFRAVRTSMKFDSASKYALVELMYDEFWDAAGQAWDAAEPEWNGAKQKTELVLGPEDWRWHMKEDRFGMYDEASNTCKEAKLRVHHFLIRAKIKDDGYGGYRVEVRFAVAESEPNHDHSDEGADGSKRASRRNIPTILEAAGRI